jgi:hypothetical protein
MYRAKVAQLMTIVFNGWKSEARYQHRLRQNTMDNWKGYARLMVFNPFHGTFGDLLAYFELYKTCCFIL